MDQSDNPYFGVPPFPNGTLEPLFYQQQLFLPNPRALYEVHELNKYAPPNAIPLGQYHPPIHRRGNIPITPNTISPAHYAPESHQANYAPSNAGPPVHYTPLSDQGNAMTPVPMPPPYRHYNQRHPTPLTPMRPANGAYDQNHQKPVNIPSSVYCTPLTDRNFLMTPIAIARPNRHFNQGYPTPLNAMSPDGGPHNHVNPALMNAPPPVYLTPPSPHNKYILQDVKIPAHRNCYLNSGMLAKATTTEIYPPPSPQNDFMTPHQAMPPAPHGNRFMHNPLAACPTPPEDCMPPPCQYKYMTPRAVPPGFGNRILNNRNAAYPTPPEDGTPSTPRGNAIPTNPEPAAPYTPTPASRAKPRTRPVTIIRTDTTTYRVTKVLEAPTTDGSRMSEGIRLIEDLNGTLFIEKRLSTALPEKKKRADAERNALVQIVKATGGHTNINVLHESFLAAGRPQAVLILQHCNAGTLEETIVRVMRNRTKVPEPFIWHIFAGLSSALSLCHWGITDPLESNSKLTPWNTISHLDIKPSNVFLSTTNHTPANNNNNYPTVVLGDFGCCVTDKDLASGAADRTYQPFGTLGWFPPEMNDFVGPYGPWTDVWQMVGLIQCLCLKSHRPVLDPANLGRPCGSHYSPDLNKVVGRCLVGKYRQRPTAVAVAAQVQRVRERMGLV